MTLISAQDLANYQRDGALYLPQALSPKEVGCLEAGIEHNLAHLSQRAKIASRSEDPGRFVEDFCTWQDNPFYQKIIFESQLPALARALMQSKTVRLYHDHLLVKEPRTEQCTPWHQDQPYYNIEGFQAISFWIPVDPVPRASSLEFIAGSHRGPWLMPRSFMAKEAKWFPEGSLAELPDIEAHREDYPVLGWAMNPGDVVCFHMLTLHAARGVSGNQRRRVFSVRFIGDDIRHAPRPWPTSPEFPGLVDELPAGLPMDHPLFPLIEIGQDVEIY